MNNRSGQALIISVFVMVMLMIAVPVIMHITRTGSEHGVHSQKRQRAIAVAEEGITRAIQQLSTPATWPLTQGTGVPGTLPAGFADDGATIFTSALGGRYTIVCTVGPDVATQLEPYQVRILSRPLDDTGAVVGGASIEVSVSRRTLSVKLPTGLSTGTALELYNPISNQNPFLWVYSGPVAFRTNNPITLEGDMDSRRFPRKFAGGPIQGTVFPRVPDSNTRPYSDNKEYWAFSDLGPAPIVDLITYSNMADDSALTMIDPPPTEMIGNTPIAPAGGPNTGRFIPASTAVFGSDPFPAVGAPVTTGDPYDSNTSVIYIQGNAELRHITVDFRDAGAIIVDGDLTLGENRDVLDITAPPYNQPQSVVREAPTRPLDDPFNSAFGFVDRTDHYVTIRSFVYVTGDLTLATTGGQWTIEGVLRVNGNLVMDPDSRLVILYNDRINRNIRVTPFELQVDNKRIVS